MVINPITSPAGNAGSAMQLQAFRNVDLHRVDCVVHAGRPDPNGPLAPSSLPGYTCRHWAAAIIDLRIDGKAVPATDRQGESTLSDEHICALKALKIDFTLVDLQSQPLIKAEDEDDGYYVTSLGNVKLLPARVPWKVWIYIADRPPAEPINIEFESTGRANNRRIKITPGDLLCCKEDRKGTNFKVLAQVKVDEEFARSLQCTPCAGEHADFVDECEAIGKPWIAQSLPTTFTIVTHPERAAQVDLLDFIASRRKLPRCIGISRIVREKIDPARVAQRAVSSYVNPKWRAHGTIGPLPDKAEKKFLTDHLVPLVIKRLEDFILNELVAINDIELCDATGEPNAEKAFAAIAFYLDLFAKVVVEHLDYDTTIQGALGALKVRRRR